MINGNGNKVYTGEEKEIVLRNYWQQIYTISPEENEEFDEEKEEEVNEFIRENIQRTYPYDNANLTRLDNQNVTIRKITIYEVKQIISGNKKELLLLINLPDSAIEYLIDISNAAISAG